MSIPKSKKKVLLVSSIFPPEIGGPSLYVQKLQEHLEEHGCVADVVTYTKSEKSTYISGGSFVRMMKLLFFLFNQRKHYNCVITFNTWSTGLPCAVASRLNHNAKYIIRVGGDYLWERKGSDNTLKQYYQKKLPFAQRAIKRIIKHVLQSFDQIVVTASWYADILQKQYGIDTRKVTLIENPFSKFACENNEKADFYLFAGRMVELKNISVLLCALSKLPQVQLVLVGEGPMLPYLQNQAIELKINDRVTFRKKVPRNQLFKLMRTAKAIIIPSLSEISPNTLLESLAVGTPVICTQECGYAERFKNEVTFFDPQDVTSLVQVLKEYEVEDSYAQVVKKVNSVEAKPTWQQVAQQYLKIL